MTLLHIVTVAEDNPVLRRKAPRVGRVDDSIRRLMDDMMETMVAAPGVGLAAPQVDVSLRVITLKVDNQLFHLANPEIIRAEGEQIAYEGCLSIPGMVGEVARAEKVVCKALNRHGKQVRIKGNGLLARAIQHEIDHLDGILFTDRLTDPSTLRRVDELGDEEGAKVEGEAVTV
ncbi:MAG: peptide deformylase [Candidatus Dormibacteria bacterium]|jgi:peptide deformylase|nr:peptide deformylase [Chloroflexota bacterium]HBV93553.1 peptide deformylase [Chloroflexota bacterium]